MLITAALISFATSTVPLVAPPSDQSPPYTLSGVRRAAAAAAVPVEQREAQPSGEEPALPPPPRRPARPPEGQQLNVGAWVPQPEIRLPRDDRTVTPSLAPRGPLWHREFLAMTVPAYASSPFELMGTRERAEAVASSVVFGVAVDGLTRLAHNLRREYHDWKLLRLRRQIDAETELAEAQYRATRSRGQTDYERR